MIYSTRAFQRCIDLHDRPRRYPITYFPSRSPTPDSGSSAWVAYFSITDTDFTTQARRGHVSTPSQSAGFTRARAAGHWHPSWGGAERRDPHTTREGTRRAAGVAAALAIAVLVASESRLSHPKIASRTQLQADAQVDRGVVVRVSVGNDFLCHGRGVLLEVGRSEGIFLEALEVPGTADLGIFLEVFLEVELRCLVPPKRCWTAVLASA